MNKIVLAGLWLNVAGCLLAQNPAPASVSQDSEPTRQRRIEWFREARFGMLVCWGLYAIPAGVWKTNIHATGYSEWIMFDEKIPAQEYALLAQQFNPVKFDAKAWVAIARDAGMKYLVLTTKAHDGFDMFKSRLTPYNVVDATPFKRDVTRELADACRKASLRFGCYYSVDRDWYRPQGPGNRYKQNNRWDYPNSPREDFDRYVADFAKPQIEELLVNYKPDLLWFDDIELKTDAQVEGIYRMIRKLRPACVINSRIWSPRFPSRIPPPCCDYISTGDNEIADRDLGFEWENPGTMNTSYGYNQNDHNWVTAQEIVLRLVEIVSKGGNYLLNVGPTAEGLIPQPSIDRLKEVGEWMKVNQTAIYGTMPWRTHGEGPSFKPTATSAGGPTSAGAGQSPVDIRFTTKGKSVFAICLAWPDKELLIGSLGKGRLPDGKIAGVRMLGSKEKIQWHQTEAGLSLSVPREKPCRYAFVYRIDLK